MIFHIILQHTFRFVFGPQHPAAHGVLCCIVFFNGEFISAIDINIGYLHRGVEKLSEYKTIEQIIPYFDRLDYVSVLANEHLMVLSFENLIRCTIGIRTSFIRILLIELTRIFNNLLAISCMLMDIGCLNPLLWAFEERDKIATLFDFITGTRMHLAFMVIGGVIEDISIGLILYIQQILKTISILVEIFENSILQNRLFYIRLRGIAILDIYDISFLGCSGILSKSCGILWDTRIYSTYELYFILKFDLCLATIGDTFDRFYIRNYELKIASYIINQIITSYLFIYSNISVFDYLYVDISIETIILLFYSIWLLNSSGITFSCIEHPKGEYMLSIILNLYTISRIKIKCADFIHVLLLDNILRGFMLHDLVTVIGNLDIVFGSIDR